jgi:hypothetical protein
MKKSILFLTMLTLITSVTGWAATLQNTDSQSYNLQILEAGRPYPRQYTIIENAQVEICFSGCMMTLVATGQTVQVNPNDSVVIDNGVMSVTAGN